MSCSFFTFLSKPYPFYVKQIFLSKVYQAKKPSQAMRGF
ncbi:hypothetical protein B4107_2952 [Bacillus safensis]|nr:hypothetical protein B4107_2952 [Bacillus safensis]